MFLLNQTPIEVEGITNAELLRTALSEKNKESLDIYSFNKKLEEIHQKIELPQSFIHREVNVGMSGGEKKKNELVHLWMLEPNFLILDEIDSGLDVDALKIVVKSLQEYYKTYKPSILIITHQIKLIDLFTPDYVHIMSEGKIIKSGDSSLAKQIEKVGFKAFVMKENKLKE